MREHNAGVILNRASVTYCWIFLFAREWFWSAQIWSRKHVTNLKPISMFYFITNLSAVDFKPLFTSEMYDKQQSSQKWARFVSTYIPIITDDTIFYILFKICPLHVLLNLSFTGMYLFTYVAECQGFLFWQILELFSGHRINKLWVYIYIFDHLDSACFVRKPVRLLNFK